MGLIIKNSIPMLMKGFPTVSDKYNVSGGILEGDTAIEFGDIVIYGSATGYYSAVTEQITVDKIAGICLATNVKLNPTWPAEGTPKTLPGEAFNLFLDGYIAVELKSDAVVANIKEGKQVAIDLTTGKLTTMPAVASDTVVALPNCYFTGMYEQHGEGYLAEIHKDSIGGAA